MPIKDKNIERLKVLISKITPLYQEHNRENDIETMTEMLQKASQDNVSVLVCGEFKRGKSSFINAFLGEDICPVDDGIATSAVSIIKYGDSKKATRIYGDIKDLHTEEIHFEDIENYAKGSSLEVDNTVILQIELPSEKLKGGLSLIDTPGVGGLDPRHLFLTLYVMPKADVTFFVVDASEPLSTTELDFFKDKILKYSQSAKIILNKSDLRPKDELQKMIQDIREKISRHSEISEEAIDVIPISSLLWNLYNRGKDEEMRISSNCDEVDNLLAQIVPSYRKSVLEDVKSCMLNSLSSITEVLSFQLSQIKEPDENAVNEYKAKLNELNTYKSELTNPNSSERLKISNVIRSCQSEVVSYLRHQNILLSQESLNQLLCRPEAKSANGGEWVLSQINIQLESIAAEIDQRILFGYSEVNKILGEGSSIVPANGIGFSQTISADLTPAKKNIADQACNVARSMLPGIGILGLVGGVLSSVVCAPVAGVAALALATGYVFRTVNTQNTQQRMNEVRTRLLPQINTTMSDLEMYVSQRFDDFNNYLVEKIKAMTDDAVKEMQQVMSDIQRIGQDKKAAAELRQKVQGDLNLVSAIQKQVGALLTNPFRK